MDRYTDICLDICPDGYEAARTSVHRVVQFGTTITARRTHRRRRNQ
ncbi:hypothetical protein HSB1_06530 [Halogranum salarium B-1]|uniref:Uncharacterized protein n=1 Tax=Halogranum salarium B-1 TaxID=1210908 RepID=J3F0I8_9EURY|nr:hypothetical protein HSB1_06530 [Halogranum salarium B-1]